MVRPKFFVNYTKYTLFISHLAHEKKRMGTELFIDSYTNRKYRGFCGRYGYIEYLKNQRDGKISLCENYPNSLIVDKDIYVFYFKFKDKKPFKEELTKAIPEFLQYGFLITEVQEAVSKYE